MKSALGIIECLGLTTAIQALDAAAKAADVKLVGYDKVIGHDKEIGVSIHLGGEVSAVNAAIEAGVKAGNKIGRVISSHVIARPHEELDPLLKTFEKNLINKSNKKSNISNIKKEEKTNTKKEEKDLKKDKNTKKD